LETGNPVFEAISSLEKYISDNNFRGYDPYDSLASPLFRLPVLKSNHTFRFISQQLIRKSPFNIRPLLGIKKGYNPVTLGLCIQAYTYLLKSGRLQGTRISADYAESRINFLTEELLKLSSKGFSGYCWGYDFDWEARYASNPAYTPTIVATGIITNALFEYYRFSKDKNIFAIIESSGDFATKDLKKSFDGGTFCYSYSPYDSQRVYNASMKAVRLLSQIFSVNGRKEIADEAKKAAAYVAENQNKDGSWAYSKSDGRDWADNFHTGYILDCFDEYIRNTGDTEFSDILQKGYQFYADRFFRKAKNDTLIPKYYSNKLYPVDSTALSQSVLTLARFGDTGKALATSRWGIENIFDKKGYFYYRAGRFRKQKISFMRWSNAWMFAALSYLFLKIQEQAGKNDLV